MSIIVPCFLAHLRQPACTSASLAVWEPCNAQGYACWLVVDLQTATLCLVIYAWL